MQLKQARVLALYLIDKYLGPGWTFKWSNSKHTYGYVQEVSQILRLSRVRTLQESRDHVEDTILHEIAHALRPYDPLEPDRPYHCYRWVAIAKALGAVPCAEKYSSRATQNWRMRTLEDDIGQHQDI